MMCAESIRVMHPLFQEGEGGSIPTSALSLRFCSVGLETVIALNKLWHSRLPRLSKSNLVRTVHRRCYAAEYQGVYFAVAVWTNPVARLLPQRTWLELRRFAISKNSPKNTASRMLGWMTRDIRKSMPQIENLISYQDLGCHLGTIYKASGWRKTTVNKDGEWDRPNRFRTAAQSATPKQRWEKSL